jgi:hypothetical protein
MVFAGAHVTSDGHVKRDQALGVATSGLFHLGEAIEHPEIDIVRVWLGDLAGAQLGVSEVRRDLERLQLDGLALAGGIFEYGCVRQLITPCL